MIDEQRMEIDDPQSGTTLDEAYRDVSAVETDPMRLRTRTEDQPVYHYAVAGCLALLGLAVVLRALPPFTSLS